jgi:hypothetical protein
MLTVHSGELCQEVLKLLVTKADTTIQRLVKDSIDGM